MGLFFKFSPQTVDEMDTGDVLDLLDNLKKHKEDIAKMKMAGML